MRFSTVAIIAAVVAVANAQTDAYPFKPNGDCVTKCLNDIGKKMYPDYTDDPASPNFLKSLSFSYEKGTPTTGAFMSQAGMCYSKCPTEEQQLYSSQHEAKRAWYLEKKAAAGGTGTSATAPAGSPSASASGAPPAGTSPASAASGLAAGSAALVGAAAAVLGAVALF